ncbi:type IV secretory system conjugative DNA transfer family protein [Rhodobium gokarnense]|uniref:Type IV secretion system protein VirD4 n=1 Tax=Rhodobium gokarnense TaxID=364296 RepID=A0ABT3HF96_9HYPH|nr:type IV secretory system conjugative DNA transfer family protein [Rhodobium gokarnense]MCW2308956.1 type IV secretion system protein VirD4 [Rhodobium gokarnense]
MFLLTLFGGLLVGFLPVLILFLARRTIDIALAVLALSVLYIVLVPGSGIGVSTISAVVGFWVGLAGAWIWLFGIPRVPKLTTFGSSEWANYDHLDEGGYFVPNGFLLGEFELPKQEAKKVGETRKTIYYGGDRHLLTIAPTRAGKGVSAIIPNLLTYSGSTIVIDPKGENALITAIQRIKMGQDVFLIDPWRILPKALDQYQACFNPLEWLQADKDDLAENAMLLADALVLPSTGSDKFWDEEAKALLMGLILYVATSPAEKNNRHLGRVRELLTLGSEELNNLFVIMSNSKVPIVCSTGERSLQKDERLFSSVLAVAQSHTHFLESPHIKRNLMSSDFQFEELKERPITVYLILPADRLDTFGRWLRLLIQQAITVNARNISAHPAKPLLFMLDEMSALGQLRMVEQAYSLMAGFGMQLWGIVQDFSQLERIYGTSGWQTFIANAGAIQYLGSRDEKTAGYVSKLCGVTTILSLSTAISNAVTSAMKGGSSTETTTKTRSEAQRSLAYPDELMRLSKDRQILLLENANPINAGRIVWYADPRLKSLGVDLAKVRHQQT